MRSQGLRTPDSSGLGSRHGRLRQYQHRDSQQHHVVMSKLREHGLMSEKVHQVEMVPVW